MRTIAGIQRDGCPHVIVVATHLDEEGVLAASEAGTLGMLRRREATPERLVQVSPTSPPARRACRPTSSASCSAPCAGCGAARRDDRAAPASLTTREQEVLRLLAEGQRHPEIASTLCYSERTVKGVIHEITTRLQLRNRSHAVAFALRNDMI